MEDNPHPTLTLGHHWVPDGPDTEIGEVTMSSEKLVLKPSVPDRNNMCDEALALPVFARGDGEDSSRFTLLIDWMGKYRLEKVANEILEMNPMTNRAIPSQSIRAHFICADISIGFNRRKRTISPNARPSVG